MDSHIKITLGKNIARLRKKMSLTQTDLAEKTDYTLRSIQFIESGTGGTSLEGCERIAKALNVSVKDLFDLKN